MTKTYHFMAGLPRSGSTVLSAILNQNPEIYSSPQTDVLEMLYSLESSISDYESYRAGLLHKGFESVINNLTNNFYSHINKPIIIDKNRGWGTPYNWEHLSRFVNPEGKVILTMRPILEVLASFIKVSKNSQKITNTLPYLNQNLWATHYRNEIDAQIDNLMIANGEIDRAIFSISNLVKNHRNRVYVVWFDDLLNNPADTLNGINQFLGLDSFTYDFDHIKETDKHDDLKAYSLLGLHDVQKKLVNPKTNPKDYLTDYVISKYGNTLDFLRL